MRIFSGRWIAVIAGMALMAPVAQASLVFDETIDRSGQGFGAIENILTFESTGGATNSNEVTGGVSWDGSNDVVFGESPAGIVDENSIKTATFTFGSLGITSADQIVVIWDPAEQGGGELTSVENAILTIYDPSGAGIWDSGAFTRREFADTINPGTGGNGFGFVLDAEQSAELEAILAALTDFSMYRIGLYAEHAFLDNGPDTWLIGSRPGETSVPEPGTLALLGAGLLGLGFARRRRA